MTMRNDREANAAMFEGARRTCPPCDGQCMQGRSCPAMRVGPYPAEDDSLSFWVGFRNAIGITAALAAAVIGGCELAARVLP
jgi:hypothetical protein